VVCSTKFTDLNSIRKKVNLLTCSLSLLLCKGFDRASENLHGSLKGVQVNSEDFCSLRKKCLDVFCLLENGLNTVSLSELFSRACLVKQVSTILIQLSSYAIVVQRLPPFLLKIQALN